MELSSRTMRFALNNTRVFGGQGSWMAERRLVRALLLVALAAAGCRGARKLPPAGSRQPARMDLTTPRAELPPAGTLPDPAAVPPPPRGPAGTLRVHLDAEPPNLNPLAE